MFPKRHSHIFIQTHTHTHSHAGAPTHQTSQIHTEICRKLNNKHCRMLAREKKKCALCANHSTYKQHAYANTLTLSPWNITLIPHVGLAFLYRLVAGSLLSYKNVCRSMAIWIIKTSKFHFQFGIARSFSPSLFTLSLCISSSFRSLPIFICLAVVAKLPVCSLSYHIAKLCLYNFFSSLACIRLSIYTRVENIVYTYVLLTSATASYLKIFFSSFFFASFLICKMPHCQLGNVCWRDEIR